MFRNVEKEALNPTVTRMVIEAPLVAQKAQPGQFIIFRASEDGERVPLTIADYDREKGTVTIIFQIVGASTKLLNTLGEGDSLLDFVGPLGQPTHVGPEVKRVCVIGGGVGNLIDRVRLGYVVDMLDCTFIEFPVFNVADCFVVCGTIAALVYYIWIYPNTDAKNWEKDHGTDPAQGK